MQTRLIVIVSNKTALEKIIAIAASWYIRGHRLTHFYKFGYGDNDIRVVVVVS